MVSSAPHPCAHVNKRLSAKKSAATQQTWGRQRLWKPAGAAVFRIDVD